MSGFFCYRNDQMDKLKAKYPEKTYMELGTVLGENWSKITSDEKKKFED